MTLEDLLRLAARIVPHIAVCKLPDEICKEIGVTSSVVRLAADDLVHILQEHKDVSVSQLCVLPSAVQFGLLILDTARPGHLISSYQDPHAESRRYKTVIRITAQKELWVVTFHRTARRQTRALLDQGTKLKNHDPQ